MKKDKQEDWFDVVDTEDKPVRRERRSVVHKEGLMHRAVHIFVIRPDRRVVIQKRSHNKDTSPGLWTTSASGHLDCGEGYDEAALREMREELGVEADANDLTFLVKHPPCDETGQEFVKVYGYTTDAGFDPDPEEIDDVLEISSGELDAWLWRESEAFADSFRLLWPLARDAFVLHYPRPEDEDSVSPEVEEEVGKNTEDERSEGSSENTDSAAEGEESATSESDELAAEHEETTDENRRKHRQDENDEF